MVACGLPHIGRGEHELALKEMAALQNDESVPYLAYSPQSGLGRIVASQLAKRDLKKIFTSHLAATLLSMVRSGDGVAWLPRTLAEDDIKAGSLVEAGDAKSAVPIEIRLFRPTARQGQEVEALWSAFCIGDCASAV